MWYKLPAFSTLLTHFVVEQRRHSYEINASTSSVPIVRPSKPPAFAYVSTLSHAKLGQSL